MIVTERYELPRLIKRHLRNQTPSMGFGILGQVVYARTYSRIMPDGGQESWAETVFRVVEGVISIRKSWHVQHRLVWDQAHWDMVAMRMAKAIFEMRFLPPGRGLWAMGTDYVFERGGMALQNCGYTNITTLSRDAAWAMDALMCGVGIGFGVLDYNAELRRPSNDDTVYRVPDSREGWVESLRLLIASYEDGSATVGFDYGDIRPAGAPIKGFGGTASGFEPLAELHRRVRGYLDAHVGGTTSRTRLVADVVNAIGACVVAGNVRRSAEIALGSPHDDEFLNLKNYGRTVDGAWVPGPAADRQDIGWMSNNSVVLRELDDFKRLPAIAELVRLNGEPGIMNLLNVQKYGRYGEEMHDPATGCNPCVTGDTRILTSQGYERIDDASKLPYVLVWNGMEWSQVRPRVTGKNQPIVRVTFDDGTHLDCTPYHKFHVSRSYRDGVPTEVEARDLVAGDKLWKYEMPVVTGIHNRVEPRDAYTQGVFAGDGHLTDRGTAWAYLYGQKSALLDGLNVASVYEDPERDRLLVRIAPPKMQKTFVPFDWSLDARVAWLAGLIDTDGTLTKDGSIQITSVDEEFLLETRLMLTTLGVQAKVTKNRDAGKRPLPDGNGGARDYWCSATYRLHICAADVVQLRDGVAIFEFLRRVSLDGVAPDRDARRFVQVVSVEPMGVAEKVYCFTEEKNHTGTFEGIVTGQCAEQPLEDKEVCCLVEVFPTRCKTDEELFDAIELAQIYAHTVSLLPTHDAATNAVVARNHRIGESLSGIADWYEQRGASEIVTLQRRGYKEIRALNTRLAQQAGVPESIRVTTVKPSGTISLLAGVSPGMHYPVYDRYVRRIRFGEDTPLVPLLIEAGVPHEPDKYSARTLVFEFPVESGARRGQRDISVWQKAAMVVSLQRHWSDNMVSNTLTFDPKTEGGQIEDLLAYTIPFTKTISLLPDGEEGAYEQMPYEKITKREYDERAKKISPIQWGQFAGSDGQDSRFCSNDSCEV